MSHDDSLSRRERDDLQQHLEHLADEVFEQPDIQAELAAQTRRRDATTEMREARWTHKHMLVEAAAVGAIAADGWWLGYQARPELAAFLTAVRAAVDARWGADDEVIQVALADFRGVLLRVAEQAVPAWNTDESGRAIAVVSRFTRQATGRSFIDFGALAQNAVNHLRHARQRDDDFDWRFKRAHPEHVWDARERRTAERRTGG